MNKHIYFGAILNEIANQNNQGRFLNTRNCGNCQVYETHRRLLFTIVVGDILFEYNLDGGTYMFTLIGHGQLHAGWDGLTSAQQMTFVSDMYNFMSMNNMTGGDLLEFIDYLTHSPV